MPKLLLETTAPFQGLPELVAYDEGLFAAEGLEVEWVDRDPVIASAAGDPTISSHTAASPFASHGNLLEQGRADMYNACEWGNYCRVGDTRAASRQVGRRGIVTFAGIAVRPDSPAYTTQQLAGRTVGVPFYAGTHYLALHLLSGFLPRDQINLVSAPAGSPRRYANLAAGIVEATTLTEPYVSLAEKNGYRILCSGFYHGTEVAAESVDAETYGAFNRAIKQAIRRINADKRRYLRYFIDYHKRTDPLVASLSVDDLRESRLIVTDPAPIPEDELQRTYDWLRSWGMLEQTGSALQLVDLEIQRLAHAGESAA